ncbi:MAG TPA: fumarylacetoacetate hydrolase family protein, partial [Actinomycetota bacterium]|nr:fumarylacetoacetate hydrolase family protein [Actinomycetota bacterium]
MRLVTYDQGGARRLGAWVGDRIVDLPDAVGHPAFPTTMEALVDRHGGTVLDAARRALSVPQAVEEAAVTAPRLLVPLLPLALRAARDGAAGLPLVLGPDALLPWPASGPLHADVELACVVGRGAKDLAPAEAASVVFGYTLAVAWAAPATAGTPGAETYVAMSLGPCLVTPDEFEPFGAEVTVRVDGERWARFRLGSVRWTFLEALARASRETGLQPGELYGSGPVRVSGRRGLGPGAVVEVEAAGVGVLRTRLGLPD